MAGQICWGIQDDEWRKGPWTAQEDKLLVDHVKLYGEGRWNSVSKLTGLKRSGKSCRLRWVNYLRPDLKRGKITPQEESIILELHALWGNRWSTIARSLPGRTDNEIKNYWRTHFKKNSTSKNIEKARAQFFQIQKQKDLQVDATQDYTHHRQCSSMKMTVNYDETLMQSVHEMNGMHDMILNDMQTLVQPLTCVMSDGHGNGDMHGGRSSSCDHDGSIDDDDGSWGSLWNLDDVHDDHRDACLALHDQMLAFY